MRGYGSGRTCESWEELDVPAERIVLGAAALPEPDRAWVEAAERLPIESIWQGGHILAPTGECVVRLALMSAWTERVRVGTSILLLPLYQPVVVAKQLADLDSHTGGRISVGVGVGGEFPKEFEAAGVSVAERGARTNEGLEILRGLWAGGPFSYHGKFYNFDVIEIQAVKPLNADTPRMKKGGPPLLVSGRKEPAMRRAARLGDGWMPYLFSPSAYARSVATIRAEAAAIGRSLDNFEWCAYLYCVVRKDEEQAKTERAQFFGGSSYGDKPIEMLDKIAPAGTPEQVAARLQEYVDAGARHIIISPCTNLDTLGVVTLAANEILPMLRLP